MKKQNYYYTVMQAGLNESGDGDYFERGKFSNLKEARKCFNKIKHETSGWVEQVRFVDSTIEKHYYDESLEDSNDFFIIDSCTVKLPKYHH